MDSLSYIKWAGLANLIAGIGTAIFWFVHPDPSLANLSLRLTSRWAFVYGLFLAVLILTLFGITGIYFKLGKKAGALGLIGYILGFVGTALFIGAGIVEGFVSPVLAKSQATIFLLDAKGPLSSALAPIFIFGGLSFAIGYTLLGIKIFRTKILPSFAGVLLLSAWILGLSPLMPATARTIGSVIFGLANVWIGYSIWANK